MNRYEGKICLVTASTAGIGLAIAERIASEGGQVIICSRKEKNVANAIEKIKKYGKVEGFVCDVGNVDQRKQIVENIQIKYGKLDVLVPNAAVGNHMGKQFEINEKRFD